LGWFCFVPKNFVHSNFPSSGYDHVKSHYIDKDLFKKDRIAKEIVHLNYDSVLELFPTSHNEEEESNNNTNVSGGSIVTYRELTQRERDAYFDALYRIKNEESIKSKGR
jgi:hypothetical protein